MSKSPGFVPAPHPDPILGWDRDVPRSMGEGHQKMKERKKKEKEKELRKKKIYGFHLVLTSPRGKKT